MTFTLLMDLERACFEGLLFTLRKSPEEVAALPEESTEGDGNTKAKGDRSDGMKNKPDSNGRPGEMLSERLARFPKLPEAPKSRRKPQSHNHPPSTPNCQPM